MVELGGNIVILCYIYCLIPKKGYLINKLPVIGGIFLVLMNLFEIKLIYQPMLFLLVVLSIYDYQYLLIPTDKIYIVVLYYLMNYAFYLKDTFLIVTILYSVKIIMFKLYKQEMIGSGDVELIGLITLVLGWYQMILIILFSSGTGIIVSLLFKRRKLPFVPLLTFGTIIIILL